MPRAPAYAGGHPLVTLDEPADAGKGGFAAPGGRMYPRRVMLLRG